MLGLLLLVLLPTAVATARPAADDVTLQVFLETGNLMGKTNGLKFRIVVEAESTSAVQQPVSIRITLPSGLAWGTDGPDPTEGCTGTSPATCATTMSANPVGTIGTGYVWDVVAERAGLYEITASVETTEPDPDTANNTDTFRFEVVAAPGGGGGGGGGGAAAVVASAAKLTPASPKAGSTVVASVRVTRGGSPVRPVGILCSASVGGAKVKGGAKAASGVASCLFRTPKSAKGKRLTGSIAFRSAGKAFTKRFAVALR